MEQARQWEEVGLRKTRSQNHAAVPPAPAVTTATATATVTRIEDEVVFEERVDVEDGRGVIKFGDTESFVLEKNSSDEGLDVTAKITDIRKSLSTVINHQNGENIRDESLPCNLSTFDESYEERITRFKPSDSEIIERASIDLIKETDEETEFELERLLEKPNSHKFYCPNCNACIEKIILLRREQERLLAAVNNLERSEPIETTFTCTSCYTFLVFIGNQLISIFTPRRKEPKGILTSCADVGSERSCTEGSDVEALVPSRSLDISLPDQSYQPPSIQKASLPVLPSDNGGLAYNLTPTLEEVKEDIVEGSSLPQGMAIDVREISENAIRNKTGDDQRQYVEENGVTTKDPLHNLNGTLFDQNGHIPYTQNASTSVNLFGIEGTEIGTTISLTEGSSLTKEVKIDIREKVDDAMEMNNEDENNIQEAAFHKESIIEIGESGKQEETFHEGYADETKGKGPLEPRFSQAAQSVSVSETHIAPKSANKWGVVKGVVYGGLTESSKGPGVVTSDIASGSMEPGDFQTAQDVTGSETITITETENAKKWGILKGIVNVGLTKSITSPSVAPSPVEAIGSDEPLASPITQVIPVPEAPTISGPENSKQWEILKSIVYGGLIESITSLSIVTSAAGADATTLNILALGLANLIGGLFVIGHNLMELRNDQSRESTSQTSKEMDRYYRQLGQRENFKLHATVVVLSFLLFGLVAPVTYGFSFLKSGNKDMKLVAVAAASLLCITMLAIGKAYIQKASSFYGYIKTILYYVIAGFMASGVSYVVGDLIKKLLEKLGLFESASTLSLPGTALAKSGWGSY
ncbi:membrane protein of ER body-like protein isoform X4 [Vitis vinifera]|uniref:membrane protein of ER body-like protein isoform X4 n=1 Tax=Vitis vinifera TaxID=29760 RepID=UPI002883006E|nr:membrane protein of ER body-like protein isoform X4 [Vitis vinifera]